MRKSSKNKDDFFTKVNDTGLSCQSILLSNKALEDLRKALNDSYGQDFDINFTDEQVNKLGNLLLTILVEGLVLKVRQSSL